MNKELTEKLFNDFPELFRGKDKPRHESLMYYGFSHDDGWYTIVYSMCYAINNHLKNLKTIGTPLDYEFVQIKEKFATLRVYDNGGNKHIDGIISLAEILSSKTCEVCGNNAELSHKGTWYKTLCQKHREELEYEVYKRSIE